MASRWVCVIRGNSTPPIPLCTSSSAEPSGMPVPTTTCDLSSVGIRVIISIYTAEAALFCFCMAVLFLFVGYFTIIIFFTAVPNGVFRR